MTTQEKLQAVTEQIRKDIPRLMELSEGCWLEVDVPDEGLVMYKSNGAFFYHGIIYISLVNTELCIHNKIRLGSDRYKIIGHEPMLNDVLEWMGRFENFGIWLPDGDVLKAIDSSNYYAEFETTTGQSLADNSIKIDFSKPYLKDQSDELINFLYNLISK